MAALNHSPSGFSYAQAAKGQTSATASQTPSTKIASETPTPPTGPLSEPGSTSNWADDVEAVAGNKTRELQKPSPETNKIPHVKETAVDRAKSEGKLQGASSGVSSPDLAASSSTTTNTDELSAQNGTSSESTWETKSQTSEPAWVAERKERAGLNTSEGNMNKSGADEAKAPEPAQPAPKPLVLHEAPPPAVNPWAKRAEEAKAKSAATAVAAAAQLPPKPATATATAVATRENQQPRQDIRKKANSTANAIRDGEPLASSGGAKKPNSFQSSRGGDARNSAKSGSRLAVDSSRAETLTAHSRGASQQRDHSNLSNSSAIPPPVKDVVSWPTPNTVVEKEKKDTHVEKTDEETIASEANSTANSGKKQVWKPLHIPPSFVYDTPEIKRPRAPFTGDKHGRSGNAPRGRGGFRGHPNGPKGGDRPLTRTVGEAEAGSGPAQRGNTGIGNRENVQQPLKPASSPSPGTSLESHSRGPVTSDVYRIPATEETFTASTVVKSQNGAISDAAPETQEATTRNTTNPVSSESQDEVKIAEPIPRPHASGVQIEGALEVQDAPREVVQPVKNPHPNGRKESRASEGFGKDWNNAPRGGKRGGRGRGGSHEYANSHPPNASAYSNGYTEFTGASPYGVPPSPSLYQNTRGNHQFGHQQHGRGGWGRGGQRNQTMPLEGGYGGRMGHYNQLQPVQTYFPEMYDHFGFPMTAVPYPTTMHHPKTVDMVSMQLEYYFSIDNLLKDMYLRQNMDSQGFVFLDIIANFNRVKHLSTDKDLIRFSCMQSEVIEIRVGEDGKDRLRRRDGWEQFLLPKEQRDANVQNDGPQHLHGPELPQMQLWGPGAAPFWGPVSAGPASPHQRRSYDSAYSFPNGVPPPPFAPFTPLVDSHFTEAPNGEEARGRATKSPNRANSLSPTHQSLLMAANEPDSEPDVFPDEQTTVLTVVVKMNQQRATHQHATSRTFSNGSIDPRSIFGDAEKATGDPASPAVNGESTVNGDDKKLDLPRVASQRSSQSPENENPGSDISLFWVKDKDMPVDRLPTDAQLESYVQLRFKALDQRRHAATGNCPYDLEVLYQFWSHFLIRNFNNKMYGEFKFLAHDDAKMRHSLTGMHNLTQFYAKALSSSISIRDRVVKDYADLVQNEPPSLDGSTFKQLRSAWRNGALNLKNRKKLTEIADQSLKDKLES